MAELANSVTLPRLTTGVTGVAPTVAMSFTYDADGNRTGATWSGGSLAASYLYDDAGGLISEALDNSAFLWQPAQTLAKTTAYDPASPINALTRVDGVTQTHDARGNRKVATSDG